jgi:RNA recognition motif-containing protein
MQIFVGNLNVMTTAKHLSNLFFEFGRVISARIISDDHTGQSLGYGYVEMERVAGASAIERLDNMNFMAHYIHINEAGHASFF